MVFFSPVHPGLSASVKCCFLLSCRFYRWQCYIEQRRHHSGPTQQDSDFAQGQLSCYWTGLSPNREDHSLVCCDNRECSGMTSVRGKQERLLHLSGGQSKELTREVVFLHFSSYSLESFAQFNILFLHLRYWEELELGKKKLWACSERPEFFLINLLSDIGQVALLLWFLVLIYYNSPLSGIVKTVKDYCISLTC